MAQPVGCRASTLPLWRCFLIFAEAHCMDQPLLVGGLEHFLFSHILGIIIPTD